VKFSNDLTSQITRGLSHFLGYDLKKANIRDFKWRLSRRGEKQMEKLDRITTDPDRMNGEPCIRNHRLTVRRVLEALAIYPDRAELKREYPELDHEDVGQIAEGAGGLAGRLTHKRLSVK
jgi:uncharacterized protein (DUF433 family)